MTQEATALDDRTKLRLELHNRIIALIGELEKDDPSLDLEDVLAALSSSSLALLSATEEPQKAYGQFLQDIAKMWIDGQRKIAEAKRSGSLALVPK